MSGPQPPRTEQFQTPAQNRSQKGMETATAAARNCPIVNGVAINNVSLGIGLTNVPHGLGRAFIGYIVTKLTCSGAAIIVYSTTPADPTKYVSLVTSGLACTVNLWVF